jgi:O-antigen/teichoic acid export membrane protein
MNTDLKHYLSFTGGQIAKILFSTLSMALLARLIGPSGLGRWAMILAAGTLAHLLFANWLQQDPFLRFGKPEWTQKGTMRKTWSARLPLLGTGILFALLVFTGAFWDSARGVFELSRTDGLLAFAFFLSLLISIDVQTLLQITGRMVELAWAPAAVAAGAAFLYGGLWLNEPLAHPVETSLAGTLLITGVIWLIAGQHPLRETGVSLTSWDSVYAKDILRFAWPILPTTLLGFAVNWGNQMLIQRSFSSHDVGLYQSAFQVHALMVSLAVPFTTIILPRIIDKQLEDPGIMKRYAASIAPTLFTLWLIAVLPVIAILPSVFLMIYGASFTDAVRPLTALLISTPFCALGQIYTVLYTVQGNLSRLFWILLIMVGANLAGAWLVVPAQGLSITHVAGAFSFAFIVSQGLVALYQHRILKQPMGKTAALITVTLIFSWAQTQIQAPEWRILAAAAGLAILIAVVRGVRAVDPDVLDHLFTGRLSPLNGGLKKLLIPTEWI